ncbi:MAG: hypothetical protein H7Z41_13640 [Cytophagales bacterium]|nr:hypothetical protein [Armatimonadota bacterium]
MYDEQSPIPPEVQDILSRLPRPMRQRVLADYDARYAPFLAMLAAWKGAVQTHYALGQASALSRLEEQFFPLGAWRFPPQTLAVPIRPPTRALEVPFEARFSEPTSARQAWISCGAGWIQPTALRGVRTDSVPGTLRILLEAVQVSGSHLGTAGTPTLLERGQLVFVAAPEAVVHALTRGQWWVKTGGSGVPDRVWPMVCERYEGFLAFEREMQAARMSQRQLDQWLPAFFPYGRKVVCFRLATSEEIRHHHPRGQAADEANLLLFNQQETQPLAGDGDGTLLRLLGNLQGTGAEQARSFFADGGGTVFYWNPVPVVQTAVTDHQFFSPFPEVGQEFALRMNGVPDLSAVVAYGDGVPIPASVARVPSSDPRATELDVEIRFARPLGASRRRARVKIYHGSLGQGRVLPGHQDAPTILEWASLRFAAPFPTLGGAVIGRPEDRAQAARTAWYHSVLRPPLLTEGDLIEILDQRALGATGSGGNGGDGGLLRLRHAAREIMDGLEDARTDSEFHWRSYLWPSLLARSDRFDLSLDAEDRAAITDSAGDHKDDHNGSGGDGTSDPSRFSAAEDVVPLIQRLRLDFEPTPLAEGIPAFLLDDVANFQASLLSQYFIVSCFRVEGRVLRGTGPVGR